MEPRSIIRVLGDCLAPRLKPGDLLYVDGTRASRTGDLIVACWGELVLIGELVERDGALWLTAPPAEPLWLGPTAVILGVALGVFRQL